MNYMSMGDMEALLLAHPNAIERWRELMGPTKPALAHSLAPRSIRSLHGLTDTRNSVHGSGARSYNKDETNCACTCIPVFNGEAVLCLQCSLVLHNYHICKILMSAKKISRNSVLSVARM